MNWLQRIAEQKRIEIAESQKEAPLSLVKERAVAAAEVSPVRPFERAIRRGPGERMRLIAELKVRSPVKGVLLNGSSKRDLLLAYQKSAASALSILTDTPFFGGHLSDLRLARETTDCPLLRKDFIVDAYQIYQSRMAGADAILLISSLLDSFQLRDFLRLSAELGMDALVEIHDEEDLDRAWAAGARCIGVNNRDLTTFEVDFSRTERLVKNLIGKALVVSESGIEWRHQVARLEQMGVDAILVGESLVRSQDPVKKISELLGL